MRVLWKEEIKLLVALTLTSRDLSSPIAFPSSFMKMTNDNKGAEDDEDEDNENDDDDAS